MLTALSSHRVGDWKSVLSNLGGLGPDSDVAELVAELVEAELAQIELVDAELVQTELVDAELVDAELVQTELVDAELVQTVLVKAELVEVELDTAVTAVVL